MPQAPGHRAQACSRPEQGRHIPSAPPSSNLTEPCRLHQFTAQLTSLQLHLGRHTPPPIAYQKGLLHLAKTNAPTHFSTVTSESATVKAASLASAPLWCHRAEGVCGPGRPSSCTAQRGSTSGTLQAVHAVHDTRGAGGTAAGRGRGVRRSDVVQQGSGTQHMRACRRAGAGKFNGPSARLHQGREGAADDVLAQCCTLQRSLSDPTPSRTVSTMHLLVPNQSVPG